MEEDCVGIAQCHGMQQFQCVPEFRDFLRAPQPQHVFGIPHFEVFGDSREFCKSDIVVPLTLTQAEGKSSEGL
jgi:hypothetical protein